MERTPSREKLKEPRADTFGKHSRGHHILTLIVGPRKEAFEILISSPFRFPETLLENSEFMKPESQVKNYAFFRTFYAWFLSEFLQVYIVSSVFYIAIIFGINSDNMDLNGLYFSSFKSLLKENCLCLDSLTTSFMN